MPILSAAAEESVIVEATNREDELSSETAPNPVKGSVTSLGGAHLVVPLLIEEVEVPVLPPGNAAGHVFPSQPDAGQSQTKPAELGTSLLSQVDSSQGPAVSAALHLSWPGELLIPIIPYLL